MSKVVGGVEILPRKVQKIAGLTPDDQIKFCVVGAFNQSLIALDERLLIAKTGFMAGATGGGRKTTFDYMDITNVEVNTGWANAVIEVLTAAYAGGTQKDFWSVGKNDDPFKASNAIPIDKAKLTEVQPYLDDLNEWIRSAKRGRNEIPTASPSAAPQQGVAEQIRELHDLMQAGALTQQEFEAAKAKLLE